MQVPMAEKGRICPFHKLDMSKVCHKCPLWISLKVTDPQTGQPDERWQCTFTALPVLTLENARVTRGVQAATESFRNEMVKGQQDFSKALTLAAQHANKSMLIEG